MDQNALLTKYLCIIYYVLYYDYLLLKLCELFNPTQQQISHLLVVRELGLKLRWIIHGVCGDLFKDKVYTLFALTTATFITLCILKDYAFGPQQYSRQALQNYGADISKLFESTLKRPINDANVEVDVEREDGDVVGEDVVHEKVVQEEVGKLLINDGNLIVVIVMRY